MTIQQYYNEFSNQLKTIYPEREALNITDWVFENVTGLKRLERLQDKEKNIEMSVVKQLEFKLHELLKHKPAQYVLNEAWFYKMKFFVNENVLIPRPETEELVEWISQEAKDKNKKLKILDIGTGSGCIAIALKKIFPFSELFAIDISENALRIAAQNANNQDIQIEFYKINFLDEAERYKLPSFDIIVSNPPYIPEKDKARLEKNVVDFEPQQALFVSDNEPFIFYKNICEFSQSHLRHNGKIFVEINEESAEEVTEIFNQYGYKSITKKDMFGKERMIRVWKSLLTDN